MKDGKDFLVSDFDYDLPKGLIAQTPLPDRAASRLMRLDKKTGKVSHHNFREIVDFLNPGDCLCINDTKVIPARLIGQKKQSEARVEVFLLKRIKDKKNLWEVLIKPGKKVKIGDRIVFSKDTSAILECELKEIKDDGNRVVEFIFDGIFEEILDRLGQVPLPPYITEKLDDVDRYQTVYAVNKGSVAAPTAGLHFTEELLEEIKNKGVDIAKITLHVGLGTFRPVKVENVAEHVMHAEHYMVSDEAAAKLNKTKENGGRIVAVGTTASRVLETVAGDDGIIKSGEGDTDIFIYPGYKFKAVDALVTNFHLPQSTLIMLVSALAGKENVLNAYKDAVENKYRFFSFGDAMYIE